MEIQEAKRRARKGPALLLARRILSLIVVFVSTFTVARLVDPSAYGLANMSGIVLAFAQIFRDFGLTNAILRKGSISSAELNFIFWFNVATTSALALMIALLAPAISRFYHEPVVYWVVLVALIGFMFEGLSLQHRGLISRELRFGRVALIESAALLVGFVTTLVLAAMYHNVWSIVIGNMVQSITLAIGCVMSSGWRPSRPRWSNEFGPVLLFGANSSVFSISVFLSNNAANLLIGHMLGSGPLGLYNRATALFQLPVNNLIEPITHATMPLLTRLRVDPAEYRDAYTSLVRKLSAFLVPGSVMLSICAVPLVVTLLGPNWREAGFVLSALAPALAGFGFAYSASDLFVTQDRVGELRKLGLIEMVIRVGAVLVGVQFGLVATALGFSLAALASAALRLVMVGRSGPVSCMDQLRAVLPALPLGIGAALGSGLAQVSSGALQLHSLATVFLIFGGGSLGVVLAAFPFSSARSVLIELARTFLPARLIKTRDHTL
ncbi:lipopolysaccharide biosynthesis protein [Sphingomonas faeni]|uniref:lipopolysaccharide biosynthesis protein n=1 Tax=Sphingomonas faeni TaxID=185950 RepID=UPI003356C383